MAATSPTMTAGVPELKTKSTFSKTCIIKATGIYQRKQDLIAATTLPMTSGIPELKHTYM